jgi:hypothetical protein
VSWPWIVLLALAVALVVAAEWGRVGAVVGSDARRKRERERRKASFKLVRSDGIVRSDDEEFVASVERDLANLPTIEERETGRRRDGS